MKVIMVMCVLTMLTGAVAMDLKTRRIANRYNLGWTLVGFIISILLGGLRAFLYSILGALLPVMGLMILFKLGVLGAGDIKLFGAVGAFVGLDIVWVVVYSFILCGIYGVFLIVVRLFRYLKSKEKMVLLAGFLRGQIQYTKVAFSVFIFGGYIWYLVLGGVELGI